MRRILGVASVASMLLAAASPATAAVHYCFGERATIVGTNDEDHLNGTGGRDVIVALGGNDVVRGRGGDDLICLGPTGQLDFGERGFGDEGNDRVSGGPGVEHLYGGGGDDYLALGGARGFAAGGPGDDTMIGSPGRDVLGGAGGPGGGGGPLFKFTYIPGEAGDDRIVGGGGSDLIVAGEGDDTMIGGGGTDRISYWSPRRGDYFANLETGRARGAGRDTFRGIEDLHAWVGGDIVLRGDDRPNVLVGAPSDDDGSAQFFGRGGDDVLAGEQDWNEEEEGDLDLYGGHGNDRLFGQCVDGDDEVDEYFSGPGDDRLMLGCALLDVDAGPGDDVIFGMESSPDFGQDSLAHHDGGPGFDRISWEYSQGRVEADLAEGTAQVHFEDGFSTRTHTLESIEGLVGSTGQDDVLLGDDGPNVLVGDPSTLDLVEDDDRIEGRGGDDELYGDDGNDDLDGGDGEDLVDGGAGVDTCRNGETVEGCEL